MAGNSPVYLGAVVQPTTVSHFLEPSEGLVAYEQMRSLSCHIEITNLCIELAVSHTQSGDPVWGMRMC